MSCNDLRERLVDFLYGELSGDDRTAFEAHVRECESCRSEVAALERTLGQTRGALRDALAEEPPPRVRAAAVAAAEAAVRKQAGGILSWLRGPWLVPAFAAACAIGLFVFTREAVMEPAKKVFSVAPEERAAAPAPVTQAEAPPPPTPEPKQELDRVAEKEARPRPAAAPHAIAAKSAAMKADQRFAQPPPPRADKKTKDVDEEGVRNLIGGKIEARDRAADRLGGLSAEGARGGAATGAGAPSPPPASAAAPAPARQAPLAKIQSRAEPKGYADGEESGRTQRAPARSNAPAAAAPAPRPAAAPAYAQKPAAAPAEATEAAANESAFDSAPAKAKKREAADDELSAEALVQRADRAFAQQRWAEAVEHYRTLVRRFPGDARVKTWTGRLRAAEQAQAR